MNKNDKSPLNAVLCASKGEVAENTFVFHASTVGNPDRSGDVILPGAFSKAAMRRAVDEGWADQGHGWHEPIGYFDSVAMDGDTLVMAGSFHSTEKAQNLRTIMTERLGAKKKVSVSIGFMPDYESVKYFETGAELLEWAEKEGHEGLDTKAIKKLGWCRAIPAIAELFECSVCCVGMNQRAHAPMVKQVSGDEDAPAATLAESLESALAAVKRAANVHEQRSEDGRTLSLTHVPVLQAIQEASASLLAGLETETKDSGPDAEELRYISELETATRQRELALTQL